MTNPTFLRDSDYDLAAIKFRGHWRFFYDTESMFLLDFTKFDDSHKPSPGDWRYGILIVTEDNAEQWMNELAGELTLDQLPYTYWEGTSDQIKLTFVIDFDNKLWIGHGWQMDQSALHDYQPDGWTTGEDNVYDWLPPEIRKVWT